MKFSRLLTGNLNIGKALKLLLIIGGVYALSVALSNTFVNIFLWKQQNEYMPIALYNLSLHITGPIIFILAGRWAKQVDRVIVLRLGVFFLAIFYLTVLLLGDLAPDLAALLGVLLGIGNGFFWLAFNVLTFEITDPDNRDLFNGFFGLLSSFSGMVGPLFAGWIITRMEEFTGYTLIFAISLGFFVLAVILSFFLKRRSAKGKYQLTTVLKRKHTTQDWRRILKGNFAHGLREGSFPFLISIWVFVAAGTEMALGAFSLMTSAISFVVFFLVGRFISHKYRKYAMFFSTLTLAGAVWVIAFDISFTRLIVYGIMTALAFPLLMVPFNSLTFDVIGRAKHAKQWRIEYIVVRELFLGAGRIVSVALFIGVLVLFDHDRAFPWFILILGHCPLIIYLLIRRMKGGRTLSSADGTLWMRFNSK